MTRFLNPAGPTALHLRVALIVVFRGVFLRRMIFRSPILRTRLFLRTRLRRPRLLLTGLRLRTWLLFGPRLRLFRLPWLRSRMGLRLLRLPWLLRTGLLRLASFWLWLRPFWLIWLGPRLRLRRLWLRPRRLRRFGLTALRLGLWLWWICGTLITRAFRIVCWGARIVRRWRVVAGSRRGLIAARLVRIRGRVVVCAASRRYDRSAEVGGLLRSRDRRLAVIYCR